MTHFSGHVPVRHERLRSQVNSAKNTCQRDALTFLKSPTKCCSRELSFTNVLSYPRMKLEGASGVFRHAPDPPISVDPPTAAAPSPGLRPTLLSIARVPGGSQPPEGGIFLPCCFAFLVGCRRVTRKAKSTPMSRRSLSKAQPLRDTDCLTLDVKHLLEHNRALITIYFPFPVR